MTAYHPNKLGSKNISSSVDIVESHIWLYEHSLWPWTWRQQTSLLAWHSCPQWCITISSLVTKDSAVVEIRYYPDEHSLEVWTISVTLTLTTTEQSTLFTSQSSLWLRTIKPILVAKGSAVQNIYIRKSYFACIILHCDEDSKPIFLENNLACDDASRYQVR